MQNAVLLGVAAEVLEAAGALEAEGGLGGERRHDLAPLAAEGQQAVAQTEVKDAVHRALALEQDPLGVAGAGQGGLARGREGGAGHVAGGEALRQAFARRRDPQEGGPWAGHIGRDQLELEAVAQRLRQAHERLARVGGRGQVAGRVGEEPARRRPTMVEPLVEKALDAQADRLQQDHQEDAGGEGEQVA